MDFLRALLCRANIKACLNSNSTEGVIPEVQEWLSAMAADPFSLSLMLIACTMTCLVLCLGLLHLIVVVRFIKDEQTRTEMYWLVFMAPIIALCGLLGMFLPRAAIFLYAIALVYYMICIFVLVCLMLTLNGSRKAMCQRLQAKDTRISLQVCPLGCCLCCFDKLPATEKNFRRCEWLVFQSPLVRILLEVLNIIVFMELNTRSNLFFQLSNLIGIVSLLIGSYASYLIIPAGASLLSEYRFLLLFRIVDISQLIWSVQKTIADLLGAIFDIKHDLTMLPASAEAQFYISFLLCVEMLFVSVLATWCFHPSKCAFFDERKLADTVSLANLRVREDSTWNDTMESIHSKLKNAGNREAEDDEAEGKDGGAQKT